MWIERKWVAALQAACGPDSPIEYIRGALGLGNETSLTGGLLGSLIEIEVAESDLKGRNGTIFNEVINGTLLSHVETLKPEDTLHIEDHYALMALCEAGVIHQGVISQLSAAGRRQVLQYEISGGHQKLDQAQRLRASPKEA